MKSIKKILCCVVACLCLLGCAKEDVQDNQKESYIIGLDDTFAPMGFRQDGEMVGFDIDLAKAVAEINDWEITFQNIDWEMKQSELDAGNIDMIWNGFSITEERKQSFLFSTPYMTNTQLIITLAGADVETKADLAGKVVSVQKDSSALEAVETDTDFVASLQDGKVIQFETNNDCFMDLEAGRSDAIVVDGVLARYMMKQKGEENYQVLDETFGEEEYAVGMRLEDTELCDELNTALQELKDNGEFDKIYEKWFAK